MNNAQVLLGEGLCYPISDFGYQRRGSVVEIQGASLRGDMVGVFPPLQSPGLDEEHANNQCLLPLRLNFLVPFSCMLSSFERTLWRNASFIIKQRLRISSCAELSEPSRFVCVQHMVSAIGSATKIVPCSSCNYETKTEWAANTCHLFCWLEPIPNTSITVSPIIHIVSQLRKFSSLL